VFRHIAVGAMLMHEGKVRLDGTLHAEAEAHAAWTG
jgi:hypothetical protein